MHAYLVPCLLPAVVVAVGFGPVVVGGRVGVARVAGGLGAGAARRRLCCEGDNPLGMRILFHIRVAATGSYATHQQARSEAVGARII